MPARNYGVVIPNEWNSYVTQTGNGLEIVPSILYDTATYVDNTTQSLDLFVTVPANESLGNLKNAGMLPNPQSFLIQNISLFFVTNVETVDAGGAGALASQMEDIVLLCNTGILKLSIGEKKYGPWPLFRLPVSTFLKGMMASAGAEAANLVHGYGQLDGPLYSLIPNLMLSPMQNFNVNLSWPAGAVNTSGNVAIKVLLDGQLARAIQ